MRCLKQRSLLEASKDKNVGALDEEEESYMIFVKSTPAMFVEKIFSHVEKFLDWHHCLRLKSLKASSSGL